MCSPSELQTVIQRVAEAYRSVFGRDITRIVLYGSYARGDYTDDSDLDMAAIVIGSRSDLTKAEKGLGCIFRFRVGVRHCDFPCCHPL